MSTSYVMLTGSKNNAGDFLIKHRAKKLFSVLRPDRKIIDMDAWQPFSDEALETINSSAALILMGGPALQPHMYPGIYPLTPDLSDIKVPITTMGIGWKSARGEWRDSFKYPLEAGTRNLLEKISASGIPCSVRDFHTLNVLNQNKLGNAMMTGCPAYYDLDLIGSEIAAPQNLKKVAFSLGVSFIASASMEREMRSQILTLKNQYSDSRFEVVFHHSLNPDIFLKTHGASRQHIDRHQEFARWLSDQDIDYIDISGSAENLIDYYSTVDLHIGYRVHAHIFMNSIAKMSILIAEDGRGKALEKVIGGLVLNGFDEFKSSLPSKVLNKFIKGYSRYIPNPNVAKDVIMRVEYEQYSGGHRMMLSRKAIDTNFSVMKSFLESLP